MKERSGKKKILKIQGQNIKILTVKILHEVFYYLTEPEVAFNIIQTLNGGKEMKEIKAFR